MAFWNKKKLDNRFISYFTEKNISYDVEEGEPIRLKFELVLPKHRIILFPYLTIDGTVISFNINITQGNKNYDLQCLNSFNQLSKFFKAYLTEEGLVVLEYRFSSMENIAKIMDDLIESLFGLGDSIVQL